MQARLIFRDKLIKYDGNKCIIPFPGKSRSESIKASQYILNQAGHSANLAKEKMPVKLTGGFGIALYPEDATWAKDLLLKADSSLHQINKNSTKTGIGVY